MAMHQFEANTFEQWRELLTKELAGRSAESLNWLMADDVSVEPYAISSQESYACELSPNLELIQGLNHEHSKAWNLAALEALMGGCNSLRMLNVPTSAADLDERLKGVFLEYITLHVNVGHDGVNIGHWLQQVCEDRAFKTRELRGSLNTDFNLLDEINFKALIQFFKEVFPLFRPFTVDISKVHEQGGNQVQELGFALTQGHAFLVRCMEMGWNVDDASALVQFNFSTGCSYFAEIAKYRAFRWAWKSIIEQYKPQYGCSTNTHISASTSRYYQSAKDVHNNLLRATTQAMSALIGGVNGLMIVPYNCHSIDADSTALRLSRNIQQLLTEESYFESYRSVANGSHYIEQLTGKMLRAGWSMFQRWDTILVDHGRDVFDAQWSSEVIEVAASSQLAFQEGRRVMVGVNKYVNKSDSSVVGRGVNTFSASQEKA